MGLSLIVLAAAFLIGYQASAPKATDSVQNIPVETRAPSSALEATHEALFETLFPIERIQDQPELMEQMKQVRQEIWQKVFVRSEVVWGFRTLDLLSLFDGGFAHKTVAEREVLLAKLEASPINTVRRGIRFLRLYYLYSIYASPLGERISGTSRLPVTRADIDQFLAEQPLHLPKSPITYNKMAGTIEHTLGEIDVLVIGSGPAGSVIAHELAKKGKRVVLLEQGAFAIPGAVDTRRILSMHESAGIRTSADGAVIFRNGNAVGGGTAVNVDLAFSPLLPYVQNNIEKWRAKGVIDTKQWTRSEFEKAYAWVESHVGTRAISASEINNNNMILWEGAKRSGRTPSLYDLNTYAPGTSPSPVINKKSSVSAFIIPALEDTRNPLAIIPGAKVTRILWQPETLKIRNKVAAGIEFEKVPLWKDKGSVTDPHGLQIPDGTKVRIKARHVIVAAGALGSPVILKRSGLNNPLIGSGPVAHPSIPLMGVFDQPIKIWEGTPSSVYVADQALQNGTILESMTADVSYAAMMLPGNRNQIFDLAKDVAHMGGFGVLLVDTPNSKNRVALNAKDQTEVHYSLSDKDAQRFSKAIADSVRIMFKAGAKKVYLPTNELSVKEFTSADQAAQIEKNLKFIPNRTTLTSAHLQATCKMGRSANDSVVSFQHRVWGTNNVYVVDGSVFPTSVGANPMQAIYTMAKIFADNWSE